MQTSYGRHDHRGRHRYRSRLCARQHGRDHRVPAGRVRDRMVHRSAAPAPPRNTIVGIFCNGLEPDYDEHMAEERAERRAEDWSR